MMGKKTNEKQMIVINVILVLALLAVVFPLLLIAQYNRPSADDWSFGVYSYAAVRQGKGVIGVLRGAFETVKYYYMNWEGRITIPFLGALQPGIWGEKYYAVVPWIMLGGMVAAQTAVCRFCCCAVAGKENRQYILPIAVPMLILQIMYVQFPVETFYWYNGSVSYTFLYALSLFTLVLLGKLGLADGRGPKQIITAVLECILIVIVGGGNFATSLSCFLSMCVLAVLCYFFRRETFKKIYIYPCLMLIMLLLCIFAPGNIGRLNGNFGGEAENSALRAIIMSFVQSLTNIYSWTNGKILLGLLFIFPFIWMAVKNIRFSFRLPGLFTLVTFGIYASQSTATMYVDGTTGGGRMAAILYYSYLLWMAGNVGYWAGWLNRRTGYKAKQLLDRIGDRFGRYLIVYCGLIGLVLMGAIYLSDLKDISSYKAYRDWRQGWAQQYAAEWDARIEVLRDESIKEVEFAPLTVCPEMLLYTDLQEKTGYYWVNSACAQYYGKDRVDIVTH